MSSFEQARARGLVGEHTASDFLQAMNWYVLAGYNFTGPEGNKPPQIQCGDKSKWSCPDLLVCRDGMSYFVEVKIKAISPTFRNSDEVRHGIDLKHYDHYKEVQKESGIPVWLWVIEEETGEVLCQLLDILTLTEKPGVGVMTGKMMYFPKSSFTILGVVSASEPSGIAVSAEGEETIWHTKQDSPRRNVTANKPGRLDLLSLS
jgi:hypothetical protein